MHFSSESLPPPIVGYVIYRRQRRDATVSDQRIAFLMEQALKETSEALYTTIAVVSEQQRELQTDVAQIRARFAAALETFSREFNRPALGRGRPSGGSLRLSLPQLRRLHRELMPPTVGHAGELRTAQVRISGFPYSPPEAAVVPNRLEALLTSWNSQADGLAALPRAEQVRRMASFHHEVLLIHPFQDGNGAVARTLLSMQLRALTESSKPVVFSERERYFEALQAANADLSLLENVVVQLVEAPAV